MNDPDRSGPANGHGDDHISRLSAAILRISLSLDLATVLDEAVESARALTSARHGVITTIDERRRVRDFRSTRFWFTPQPSMRSMSVTRR